MTQRTINADLSSIPGANRKYIVLIESHALLSFIDFYCCFKVAVTLFIYYDI